MPLPNDFRALAKAPMPPLGVGGNPMQVSGTKLQENFEYLDKKDGLPKGQSGDMLYHDGIKWLSLNNPGSPAVGYVYVLQHNGNEPTFVEYKQLTVDICVDGTPTSYTILGIPTV